MLLTSSKGVDYKDQGSTNTDAGTNVSSLLFIPLLCKRNLHSELWKIFKSFRPSSFCLWMSTNSNRHMKHLNHFNKWLHLSLSQVITIQLLVSILQMSDRIWKYFQSIFSWNVTWTYLAWLHIVDSISRDGEKNSHSTDVFSPLIPATVICIHCQVPHKKGQKLAFPVSQRTMPLDR